VSPGRENTDRLSVAIAAPIPEGIAEHLTQLEPRLDLRYEPDLLPPMRHPADFEGDPSFRRSPADQERFTKLLDDAEALYGIPDLDPAALRRTVRGRGRTGRGRDLAPDELARIVFTTSAGVHALPLAEFALFGLVAGAKSLPRLRRQQGTNGAAGGPWGSSPSRPCWSPASAGSAAAW
jgi:hypothetical protein